MIMYGMLYATAVALPILFAALVGSAVLRRCGRSERGIWLVALGLALTVPAIALLGRSGAISATPMPLPETGVLGLPAVVAVPVTPSGLGLPVPQKFVIDKVGGSFETENEGHVMKTGESPEDGLMARRLSCISAQCSAQACDDDAGATDGQAVFF